jgi:hypothetical protein
MAKFSHKKMGKEVGSAEEYAQPHGKANKQANLQDPNKLTADQFKPDAAEVGTPRVSLGNPANPDVETQGIKIRGTGAATKGLYARGPMA